MLDMVALIELGLAREAASQAVNDASWERRIRKEAGQECPGSLLAKSFAKLVRERKGVEGRWSFV